MKEKIYKYLVTVEKTKKIGLFRIITAILGGMISSYLGMTALSLILPFNVENTSIISLMFNTLAWATIIIWISVSVNRLTALLRFLIPTIIFSTIIYFLY